MRANTGVIPKPHNISVFSPRTGILELLWYFTTMFNVVISNPNVHQTPFQTNLSFVDSMLELCRTNCKPGTVPYDRQKESFSFYLAVDNGFEHQLESSC